MQKFISKKEKAFLYLALGLFVFAICLNFIVIPFLKQNEALNQEIYVNRAKLNKYTGLLRNKVNIQDRYNNFFGRLAGKIVKLNKTDSILSNLDSLAKSADIRIIDMRPQGASKSKELIIDLKTEGEIENYLKFLYNFEYSLPLLRIKKFQLNAKPNTQFLEGSFTTSMSSITE